MFEIIGKTQRKDSLKFPTPTLSLDVGRCSTGLFVCLFVRSITQKRMIPKCSNLVQGYLGYSRNDMVLGFQGQIFNDVVVQVQRQGLVWSEDKDLRSKDKDKDM